MKTAIYNLMSPETWGILPKIGFSLHVVIALSGFLSTYPNNPDTPQTPYGYSIAMILSMPTIIFGVALLVSAIITWDLQKEQTRNKMMFVLFLTPISYGIFFALANLLTP